MYSRVNKKGETEYVGRFKGELKKFRGVFNTVTRRAKEDYSRQADRVVQRIICAPIPPDQDILVAKASGQELDTKYFNPILQVRVI